MSDQQKRGTTFPLTLRGGLSIETTALMDTGAGKSCINYVTFEKIRGTLKQLGYHCRVVGADGSDLGALGTVECEITLGSKVVTQSFVVCRNLQRNVILGVDFCRRYCAGVKWTPDGTRILTIGGKLEIEVSEDELGVPVVNQHTLRIPLRTSVVLQVEVCKETTGPQTIFPNRQLEEKHPNIYQHEILYKTGIKHKSAITALINLDQVKILHIPKNTVVGFARSEVKEITCIEIAEEWDKKPYEDCTPSNWIPQRNRRQLSPEQLDEISSWEQKTQTRGPDEDITSRRDDRDEISSEKGNEFEDIQEVEDSDFIISPGDIYPNRKTELEDAEISSKTKERFEKICREHDRAFSKNNKDIGKTQLIEMEIDTGDQLPVAQNPYTLPLKHYEWVRKEIETLEKAGVIERSLSPWASPVIVVPKKSAPDEPPRRRLCVDYRKVNDLQQKVSKTDNSTGCLSLYPLPKIDEMFAKLNKSTVFSTIDLRSDYYHIGLTRESRAKSAFIVPMGKWQFRRTPFGLSQAPAYFQMPINKVLMGCGTFAMGYLDDIIIFSENEEDHLRHVEEIFRRLEYFDLKMKREKCAFFKRHIQYLGHVISKEGIQPLPEKLDSIRNMPHPKNPKEAKQFLGLIGYYRKFVPHFADIARPLTQLTRHDIQYEWTEKCQKSFDHLRELLMKHPILRYPDPQKPYTLFTDASGIGWSGVLTQEYVDGSGKSRLHPVCYVSGQFKGSQLNWAALTKEAYAIYMAVRRLTFYITDADVTIKSDHLPLRKFLTKETMNAKVNNWAVELEQFKLKLEWIQGSKNTLADSLSRLLDIEPDAENNPELEGQEFGAFCFQELEKAEVREVYERIENITVDTGMKEVLLPMPKETLKKLQKADDFCKSTVQKLKKDEISSKIFIREEEILRRLWVDGTETFNCIVVPKVLQQSLLILAHDKSGHNGAKRTYEALKRNYYWQGMRKEVFRHCKSCKECLLQNQNTLSQKFGHFKTPDYPMQLICMDLVGPITPTSMRGNRYILTVVDMLTGYTMAIPIPNKTAEMVVTAYRDHVYCLFGGSTSMLTDNGTEFKNEDMENICAKLGIRKVFTPVYTPECNGKLEGWHKFFKACIAKHIRGNNVEWDELVPLAVAAYNFFPCQTSKESPFVLMFRRDPVTPFCQLLEPAPRYWGDRGGHLKMDALQRMYVVAAQNVKWAREKQQGREEETTQKLKVNDLVLVKDPDSPVFHPKYLPNFRVKEIHGNNRIVVQDEKGNTSTRRASHVKRCPLKDKITMMVPTDAEYSQFGRPAKLLIHPKDVPDLKFPGEKEMPLDEEDDIPPGETIECAELNINLAGVDLPREVIQMQGKVTEKDEISSSMRGGLWTSLKRMGDGWGKDTEDTSPQTFTFFL